MFANCLPTITCLSAVTPPLAAASLCCFLGALCSAAVCAAGRTWLLAASMRRSSEALSVSEPCTLCCERSAAGLVLAFLAAGRMSLQAGLVLTFLAAGRISLLVAPLACPGPLPDA